MYYIMYMILIISTIFQDLPILESMGGFGRAITSLITIVFFAIYIITNKKILIQKQEKKLIRLAVYLLIIDVISIAIMFITNQLYEVNEYLPLKTIKGFMFFATNVAMLILLTNLQSKLDAKKVFYPFYITFIILFVILLLEMINPDILNIFHRDKLYAMKYGRIRLLTAEASYTTTIIVTNFVLAFFYSRYIRKQKVISAILILMLGIFIFKTTSKSLIAIFFISAAIVLMTDREINKNVKRIVVIALLISACVLLPFLYRLIVDDITNYTSTITRAYCMLNALWISFIYPFGTGNGLYLPVYLKSLKDNFHIIEKIPIKLNTREIRGIINSTDDTNVTAKSGVLQYGIYWGIIGTIYFVSFIYDLYKQLKQIPQQKRTILEFGLIFVIINIFFAIDFDCRYEIFAYVSCIIYYINNANKFEVEKKEQIHE